jgi:hypothetical protein
VSTLNNQATPIEIRQVVNGYIVSGGRNFARGGEDTIDSAQVFQTMTALVDHLKRHFTFRNSAPTGDA